ncbi:MAG: recombinase family protein, partial [Pseudonocardia sp.]|nr:recombinase family protein [Pseudonocardia sp.]
MHVGAGELLLHPVGDADDEAERALEAVDRGLIDRYGIVRSVRALIMVRVSKTRENGSSSESQEELCRKFCKERGWTVVGVAIDNDVSGSTDPMARKGAGPWLRDRISEFDVVVAWKLNRIGRNEIAIGKLVNLLREQGKSIATADHQVDASIPVVGPLILDVLK